MNAHKQGYFTIQTPDGIRFSLMLADPVSRFLAFFLDMLVIMVGMRLIRMILSLLFVMDYDFANSIMIIGYFLLQFGYHIAFEYWWHGQTVGKKLFSLQVIDRQSVKLDIEQIVLRNILRVVDSLPGFYLIGVIVIFFNDRNQRFGDIVGNTLVIHKNKIPKPHFEGFRLEKYNSLLQYPNLVNRLRNNLPSEAAQIGIDAILRCDDFTPENRLIVFNKIATFYQSVVPFPESITEVISDEQYVRNVIQLLYQQS